ncbi:MAG: hypothetical protein ACYDDF_02730 [Thermoplasmatota archaeon]
MATAATTEESILATLAELDRWRRRQTALREELERVNRQVAYYEALSREMKRKAHRSQFGDFIRDVATVRKA